MTEAEIATFLRELENHDKKNPSTSKPLSGKSRKITGEPSARFSILRWRGGFLPKERLNSRTWRWRGKTTARSKFSGLSGAGALLENADPALIPFLSIGAFAGLRHAELQRLDWSEVRLDDGFIEVKASKAKTASRRLVPIPDNFRLWLKDHAKAGGPVCDYANMSKQFLWLSEGGGQETQGGV